MTLHWLFALCLSAGENPTFREDVQPLLTKYGCSQGACHGALSGKGGFVLSLRGDDPEVDWRSIVQDAFGRRVDTINPRQSLLLAKPTGKLPHEGGVRFSADSHAAKIIAAWLASGAQNETAPDVESLHIHPASMVVDPKKNKQQLRVEVKTSNGTSRDVTHLAAFDVSDPTKFAVDYDGLTTANTPTDAVVSVRYRGARATSRITFPVDRPKVLLQESGNPFDQAIARKLADLRITPTPICDDTTYIRRAYLATIGTLPTPVEVQAFLRDKSPDKRAKLAEKLTDRTEFADFWALKWADVLRNERKTMGKKGSGIFQTWLRQWFAADLPMDDFARRLIAGLGSTWTNPAASFHRTNRDPTIAAESAGQIFWGVRIQCARCHNHPFDRWKQDDFYGFSAYFSNLERVEIDNKRKDGLDSHEITGDVLVLRRGPVRLLHPLRGDKVQPKPLSASDTDDMDPTLEACAEWIVSDPQFSRNMANRIWYHLLGRGVVEGPDDFRDSNPPSNPELLDALANYFDQTGRRTKPLVRAILVTDAFQRSLGPENDELGAANFAFATPRPIPAEVLLDAVSQVLEQSESFDDLPQGRRAIQLPDGPGKNGFLAAFGKPNRLLVCECERSNSTTLGQAFQMINGKSLRPKLTSDKNRIGRLLSINKKDGEVLDEFFLAALSRLPTENDRKLALKHLSQQKDRRSGWEDIVWALLNTKEFLLIR